MYRTIQHSTASSRMNKEHQSPVSNDHGIFHPTKSSFCLIKPWESRTNTFSILNSPLIPHSNAVMVAAMHRKVVAVDPILNNLAMIHHSLKTVNNEDYVTLMNNPVRWIDPSSNIMMSNLHVSVTLLSCCFQWQNTKIMKEAPDWSQPPAWPRVWTSPSLVTLSLVQPYISCSTSRRLALSLSRLILK